MAKEKLHTHKKTYTPSSYSLSSSWGLLVLLLVTFLVYAKSINYFITHLDDYILIFEKESFNQIKNIFKAFTVGTFDDKDIYYRPLLQITFMLEQLFKSDSLALYHIDNILLHLACTYLVFRFFIAFGKSRNTAFVLAALFALHPALTMAVVWIPGRNDTLLTLFSLLFFIQLLRYTQTGSAKNLYLQFLFFFLALFTKETAFFIPFVAAYLLWLRGYRATSRAAGTLTAGWLVVIFVWFIAKSFVSDGSLFKNGLTEQIQLVLERMPRLLMYLGKVIFPVELSNYPSAENMSTLWGIAASVILVVLIVLSKNRNLKLIVFGAFWFVIFIAPFFLVPKGINDQVFEHRLYLPILGIWIILTETPLFNGEWNISRIRYILIPILIFNINQIQKYMPRFKNPIVFWENAVRDSPNSSYANNILATRYVSEKRMQEALPLFQKAYNLNKAERYCRYFIAKEFYLPRDSVNKAISLLKEEIEINPTYIEAYFELSHIYYLQNNLNESLKYMEKCKELRPDDPMINNNLLLTYIKLAKKEEALNLSQYMLRRGMNIPAAALREIENLK